MLEAVRPPAGPVPSRVRTEGHPPPRVNSGGYLPPRSPEGACCQSDLLTLLREIVVKRGDFTLASGKKSKVYVDAKLAVMRAPTAQMVGAALLRAIDERGWNPWAVGGMEAGAIPLATATVCAAGANDRPLKGFFIRKERKGHGRNRRIEGVEESAGDVVILEDTATTGKSTLAAIDAARDAGFTIIGALALVDREMGARELLAKNNVDFGAVFTLLELTASD